MTPNEYQQLANRTVCPQPGFYPRGDDDIKLTHHASGDNNRARVLHSAIGMCSEAGEILGNIQKWGWYGGQLDIANLVEEYGDILWYVSEGLTALGVPLEQVMEANIRKLTARYPTQYTDYLADEANRNREAEANALGNRS